MEAAVAELVNTLLHEAETQAEIEEVRLAHNEYWRNHGN